jgi:hypothetical protein
MKIENKQILKFLSISIWIAFIVMFIVLLVQVFLFILGLFTEIPSLTYVSLDFLRVNTKLIQKLRHSNLLSYIGFWILTLTITFLKFKIIEYLKDIFMNLNLQSPFIREVVELIEKISYTLFIIIFIEGIQSIYNPMVFSGLGKVKHHFTVNFNYLFLVGVIFIISQIFKRGIELQEENELTV